MSYDLYFDSNSGKKIDKKSFAAYFRARPNYQVENGQALYQNEDTGVYFIFDEPEEGIVAFNLNFFRPHVFGLEAAPELENFAKTFAMKVHDPQDQGMGDNATFTREGFLRGWNAGNRFGYRAMLKEQTEQFFTWPSRRIREVWEWNYTRGVNQEKEGEEIFLPTIMTLEVGGNALAAAIWPPQCPILMPGVDAVLVPLGQNGKKSEEMALVPWNELAAIARPYQEKSAGIARYRLPIDAPEIAAFLQKPRKPMPKVNGVTLDQLLDQELVDEVRKR